MREAMRLLMRHNATTEDTTMKTKPCCQCGDALVTYPGESPRKLSLCRTCWSRMSQIEIVLASHAHDDGTTFCLQHTQAR